jgi:hypothetical protein
MERLVETSRGPLLIDRNGPYGSVMTFGDGGWVAAEAIFEGERGLAQRLEDAGLTPNEAALIASDYWSTWDTRFASDYYAEARRTVRAIAICAAAAIVSRPRFCGGSSRIRKVRSLGPAFTNDARTAIVTKVRKAAVGALLLLAVTGLISGDGFG